MKKKNKKEKKDNKIDEEKREKEDKEEEKNELTAEEAQDVKEVEEAAPPHLQRMEDGTIPSLSPSTLSTPPYPLLSPYLPPLSLSISFLAFFYIYIYR